MESSVCLTSSSSSSSSPSIGLGSNEQNDSLVMSNEELGNGEVVHTINRLTSCIDQKLILYKTNNNNNINNFNINNINKNSSNERPDMNSSTKELSKLYAIRGECYLKLGLHQLAFDDCLTAGQYDRYNPNCFYLKGRALLGLKQKESAEQSFKMALELRKNYSEAPEELVKMRFEALKEAGFDESMANRFTPKTRSVNETIDHILSASLTSDQLSNLRASYTRSLTNPINPYSTPLPIDPQFSSISGIFGNNNNNNINNLSSNGNTRANSTASKLMSDLDDCFGAVVDSEEEKSKFFEEKIDNNIISATNSSNFSNINNNSSNNSNNNFCDIGDNNPLISRSLSPQMSQNIFGISSDLQLKQKANNFSIDLNKDSLGSHIIPKTISNFRDAGTGSGEPPRKTFADIASANTKKPVQSMKVSANLNTKTVTNGKTNEKLETKDIFSSRLQKALDSGNKVSSLESFCAPNTNSDGLDKIEKIGQIVLSESEPTRPTNIMAYKGLWVCNISPEASYITLKKVFRKYGNFTGIQTFERKATNGSNIVFVHYDNNQSPIDAIAELFNIFRKDICLDEKTPLKLRFTPSMEQTKSGDLPSMEKAKRVVEKTGECFNWRLSTGCHKGDRCAYKHITINKSIDSQPWVKALKKKANET